MLAIECQPSRIEKRLETRYLDVATNDLDEAIIKADAINVLRMQLERDTSGAFPTKIDFFKQYGISEERLKKCK